jgi:Protein of unknown function (DUF2924)
MAPSAPRPRRSRRRGRSFAQSEQELRDSVTARVLALPNCPYRELGEQWRAIWGTEPPRKASREFLIRAVAYGIQVQAFGGLDAKTLQLLRKANGANGARPKPQRIRLSKGSKLFREWHGETHEVLVLDKGFAWRSETYDAVNRKLRINFARSACFSCFCAWREGGTGRVSSAPLPPSSAKRRSLIWSMRLRRTIAACWPKRHSLISD